ncbi:MFS transporter [Alphaproteobacteria bacterium]|nr:MFS transporter [Alphaproteobacteria bacterium]
MLSSLKDFSFSKELKFLYLSFFLFAVAFGINLVIFPTNLRSHGVSPALIGFASAIETMGAIITSFFLAKFVNNLGIFKSLKITAIIYACLSLLLYFYLGYFYWLLTIFIIGCCWFVYVITRVSWLNILLTDEKRGIGIGIFSMIISLGVCTGPLIVKIFSATSFYSYLASGLLTILSMVSLTPLKDLKNPVINSQRISLGDFFKKNPQCFLARFFLDFQSFSLMTFSVIYGVSLGYTYESAGLFISAYYASGFFDLIAGIVSKKFKVQKLINFGFFGCIYCFLILLVYHNSYWFIILVYFLFGAFIAFIFVAVYKMMNEDYGKDQLVSAGATFQLIGTLGSICGSLTTGIIFQIFGPQGFPATIILGCTIYIAYLLFYEKKFNN